MVFTANGRRAIPKGPKGDLSYDALWSGSIFRRSLEKWLCFAVLGSLGDRTKRTPFVTRLQREAHKQEKRGAAWQRRKGCETYTQPSTLQK